jgi:hypothetical protein
LAGAPVLPQADVMNDPVAGPFLAVFDISPGSPQWLRSRAIERQFDHLRRLVCRLDPGLLELAFEPRVLVAIDGVPLYFIAWTDIGVGDQPVSLFTKIGR